MIARHAPSLIFDPRFSLARATLLSFRPQGEILPRFGRFLVAMLLEMTEHSEKPIGQEDLWLIIESSTQTGT
jgi:hypothetical protein